MPLKPILNGMLVCGHMCIPVGVCTATRRKDMEFRTLHKKCLSPISQNKECPICMTGSLQADELVKGFEFSRRNYVALDDVESLANERSRIITIRKFIPWDQVDELQVEKHYYLAPGGVLKTPYALLSNAMGGKEVVAIGSACLWGKEYPTMIWTRDSGVLVMSLLYCYDEVVTDEDIASDIFLVPDDDQDLTNQLVAAKMTDLVPQEDLVSHSRGRISDYVMAKVNGVTFEFAQAPPEPVPTVDIQAALKLSIAEARK